MFEELDELSQALEALRGNLGAIKIENVQDEEQVQRAFEEADAVIDSKLSQFVGNGTVEQLAENMKASIRKQLREAVEKRCEEARRLRTKPEVN